MHTVDAVEDGQAASTRKRVDNERKNPCPLSGADKRGHADMLIRYSRGEFEPTREVLYGKALSHPQSMREARVLSMRDEPHGTVARAIG